MPYYVYMMSNSRNTIIYTGVTNDLIRRVYEHHERLVWGFTKRYNVEKLVYYESFASPGMQSRERRRSRAVPEVERLN